MIYCRINDLEKYSSYSKNMEKAINYILTHNLNDLPFGKTNIDDETIYINKSNVELKKSDSLKYESHKKYIDIQIDLDGDESIYINNGTCDCIKTYKEVEDFALYGFSNPDLIINLDKNCCAIIFPNEIHMPCIKHKAKSIIKCVIKVLDDKQIS